MKRALIIIAITIACLGGLFVYLTWNGGGNPDFMHHRYNRVVTLPLAKLGFSDSQYKMGLYYLTGAVDPPLEEYDTKADLEQAIYWLEKAAVKGHKDANNELALIRDRVRLDSLHANGMRQVVLIHLNTEQPCDAVLQTLYDADSNEYYYIKSVKKNGKWEEIDSRLHDLKKEFRPEMKPHIQDFILFLQDRASHVADIDGDLYLIDIKNN